MHRIILSAAMALIVCAGCAEVDRPASSGYRDEIMSAPRLAEALRVEEPSGPLTRETALALALKHNPALASFAWDVRAADAARVQAGLLPNPVAEAEFEEFGGGRSGTSEMDTTLTLSQEIQLGGKREARVRAAAREHDRAGFEYEAKRREVLRDTARAFAEALAAQRRVALAEEALGIATGVDETITKAFDAGAVPQLDAVNSHMALAVARNERAVAGQELAHARAGLAAMWGKENAGFSQAEGELDRDVALPALEVLRDALKWNPELAAAAKETEAREALLDLERAKRIPDVTLRAGYRRVESERVDTMVAGVALPLPLFDRNQGAIREAEARLARAEWDAKARVNELLALLAHAHGAVSVLLDQRKAYRDEILPGAQKAFEATAEGYRQRTLGYLELLTAQEKLAKVRREYVDVLERLAAAVAETEYLVGASLETLPAKTGARG
jgi:outer membrane protein, heavy metal efflux system